MNVDDEGGDSEKHKEKRIVFDFFLKICGVCAFIHYGYIQ